MSTVRKAGVLLLGWVLVIVGILALALPGPGLLLLFAGLAVLSSEYAWARKRVDPVKQRALQAARDGVQTRTRIVFSFLSALSVVGAGVVWGLNPRIFPELGPFGPGLPAGGWVTGVTLIVSGVIAVGLVVESVRRFRPGALEKSHRGRPLWVSATPAAEESEPGG